MTIRPSRKKSKNPPYLSHEFIISNHGDIVSFVAMIIVMGLLYKGTHSVASNFLFIQHNVTDESNPDSAPLYSPGRFDICMVFFYTLICIVVHAVLQEYIFDKISKKLNLTKVRLGKFNESIHLTYFYALSVFWGVYNILNEHWITNFNSLWDGYPHITMPFWTKMFMLTQICYWLHDYPELYFQRVKAELIPSRLLTATIFFLGISGAYIGGLTKLCMVLLILHYAKDVFLHGARALHLAEYTKVASIGFTIWNVLFIPVQMLCIILPILVLHYGLGKQSVDVIDLANNNFNTKSLRMAAMVFLVITQAHMVWNFITFHQRSRRDKPTKSSGWFGSSAEANGAKRKDRKKVAKREEEESSDAVPDSSSEQRELRQRKVNKTRA